MINFDNTANAFAYRSTRDLKKAYWLFRVMASPTLTKIGAYLTPKILWIPFVRTLIKKTIYAQFCGGVNLETAAHTAQMLNEYGVTSLLDYGAEGKETEAEFDQACEAFVNTIQFARKKDFIPYISIKITAFCRFDLLQKLNDGQNLNPTEIEEKERVLKRLLSICEAGALNNTTILIDAEESWIQQPVDDMAQEMMQQFNKQQAVVYNTFQLYRHDRLAFLKQSIQQASESGYILGAKIVRGAYMEKERARAEKMNYPSPIQPTKAATDADYNKAIELCLNQAKQVATFIGTHNEHSCLQATQLMLKNNIPNASKKITFSQLFGMSDNISFNLAKAGYNVCKYMPYGPVKDVIPYLLRRANENTSVAGQTTRELDLISTELKRR